MRIDASDALRVAGVIDVLSHENRPPMASTDSAYKDETAPKGSPFRPLYDDRIMFSGQPIALVVAEEPEIARFAASLVRVEYDEEAHVTDVFRRRDEAVALEPSTKPPESIFGPPKPRGSAEKAFAAAEVRHAGEYYVPIEHHNPMELYASTVVWEGDGKLTIYDKTQGVQNVHRYVCGVFDMKPDDVRVMSAYMGGGFGSGLRPQYEVVLAVLAARALERSVRVVLTRQQMYVLGYRPAMIQRIELGARPGGTLEAITHEAITVTSQYEDFYRQESGWSGLLYTCANAKYAHKLARLDLPTSCDMRCSKRRNRRLCARMRDGRARRRTEASIRSSCACAAIRTATRTRIGRTAARACALATIRVRRAFGWEKRNPEPRSMRDGNELVGWGMATGVWEALQMPIGGAHRALGQWPCGSFLRDVRYWHRHLHDHGASGGRHAGAAYGEHHHQAR